MIDFVGKERYDFSDLVEITKILRSPGGCPWDIEQTHASVRYNFLEEVYEAVDAIDSGDPAHLREELGDVFFQVLFHARMAEEDGEFDIGDVIDTMAKKLVRRHPHIFGDVDIKTSAQVIENWDKIKLNEYAQETVADSMASVPRALPALMRAQKIHGKSRKLDLGYSDANRILDAAESLLDELRGLLSRGENATDRYGELLFTLACAARYIDAEAEEALTAATDKFIERFTGAEKGTV